MAYPYYPWGVYGVQQPTMPYNPFSAQTNNLQGQARINAQNASSGFTWVQGIEGAKAHIVPAGVSALLMDSESERFYIKGSDASGMPLPLRVYEYKEITENASTAIQKPYMEYVTMDEFEKFKSEMRSKYERSVQNDRTTANSQSAPDVTAVEK